jgi:hypothetical protein
MSDEQQLQDGTAAPPEAPKQSGEYPTWQYPERREPQWGQVTKEGLVVGRGTNKKVIPPDEVYHLATLGCSVTEMSEWFGVSQSTLKYNFGEYIKKGKEHIKNKLRDAQMKLALSGNATMLIWLGKNLLSQSDNPINAEANEPLPWSDEDSRPRDELGAVQDTD